MVIFDGLSEKSHATLSAVDKVYRSADVRAFVITTRFQHTFQAKEATVLKPMGITGENIPNFISKYLKRSEVEQELSGKEIDEVSSSVNEVFGDKDEWKLVTPLIVTLVADHAFELWRRNRSLDGLAGSTVDAIIAYVRRLNPLEEKTPQRVPNEIVIPAGRILAQRCLRSTYAPGPIDWNVALAALNDAHFETGTSAPSASDILQRFILNDVLEKGEVLGTTFLKFNLDPVAEYLAAMYWITHLRGDVVGWNDWLKEVETAPGYPEGIQGFLWALEDCVEKGKVEFGVPDLVFPWSKDILQPRMGLTDTIPATSSAM